MTVAKNADMRQVDMGSIELIDTHCHLHDREFFEAEQAEAILKRASQKNVKKIVCIGTSHDDSLAAQDFARLHNNVYWTYGVHPEHSKEANSSIYSSDFDALKKLFADYSPIGIGEVGLDYHYETYNRLEQIKLFEKMLELASSCDLPLSFHVREAFDDFFPIITNFPRIRGVVHSFSDNKKNLKKILTETNFYVGVNGMATYSTLPTPPLDRILLETDAPFLTPVPFRGIINECGYIREIAEWLAMKLAVDYDQIERETTSNAEKLFRFSCTGFQ